MVTCGSERVNNRELLELVMVFSIHVSSMIVVGVILQGVNVSFNDAPLLQRNKMAPTAVVSENLSHLHM